MTRLRSAAYAGLVAIEAGYLLHKNAPSLWPPSCSRVLLDVCIVGPRPFPWVWLGLAALLVFSAIAILLRAAVGIAGGFVAQALFLAPFIRDVGSDVGSFLSTGTIYSGINPAYRDLAFNVLVLALVIGPAFTLLLLVSTERHMIARRPARTAAALLAIQLVALVAAADLVFRATYQDCLNNGPGTPIIDGVPGCPDFADLDTGSLVATIVPSAAVLLAVCAGAWQSRHWAITGGIVWQVQLCVALGAMAVGLWDQPSQNAWYDHFPAWSSPRDLAYALLVIMPMPALAALFAASAGGRDAENRLATASP